MKKNKKYSNNETLFRLDMWMALHQRLCWLILFVLAIGGEAALMFGGFLPKGYEIPVPFVMMLLYLALYRWVSIAPYRSLRKWEQRLEPGKLESEEARRNGLKRAEAMLNYVCRLEKALPDFHRRQMNYFITGMKATLMADLGRKEEALALLRGFNQYWDESQKTNFQKLMDRISEKKTDTD